MGLLEKVKNFFYDEEIDEDESDFEEVKKKEVPVKSHYKERMEKQNIRNEELSERELFKVERTFNFPMDVDDTEDAAKEENIKDIVRTPIKEENEFRYNNITRDNAYTGIRSYASNSVNTTVEKPKEEKKFKPTPVISPIYGVLDKNYKKEDLNLESTREFNAPKKLDYDTVRKKAYGSINKDETKDEPKGIFFNLDEEKNDEFNSDDDDVKIIYNDVSFEEEDDNSFEKNNEEEPEEDLSTENENIDNEQEDDDKILSESNEEDLFNLIDNMYNFDEDEGDEE